MQVAERAAVEVRPASVDDAMGIADLAWRFVQQTAYAQLVGATRDSVASALIGVLEHGFCHIAVEGKRVVGLIAACMSCPWIAPAKPVVCELGWFVHEDYRGTSVGIKLLLELEAWARAQNAPLVMSDLVRNGEPTIGNLLERAGYTLVERSHIRGAS